LIKLKSGIGGRTYNWIMDFLFDRRIQVRFGKEYPKVYSADDIFNQVEHNVGKSL